MSGEYKEQLPFGIGDLVVNQNSWNISFYFRGPDYRYNGDWVNIQGKDINFWIDAYRHNWRKYCEVKKIQSGLKGETKIIGDLNMDIYIGGYFDGVCIKNYHMPLNTQAKIDSIIESFKWAKDKAPTIMTLLKSL